MNNNDALIKAIEWCDSQIEHNNQVAKGFQRHPYINENEVYEEMKTYLLSLQSQQGVSAPLKDVTKMKEQIAEILKMEIHYSKTEEKKV